MVFFALIPGSSYENSTADMQFTFTGLTPYMRYTVAVRAKSAGEVGPAAQDNTTTLAEGQKNPKSMHLPKTFLCQLLLVFFLLLLLFMIKIKCCCFFFYMSSTQCCARTQCNGRGFRFYTCELEKPCSAKWSNHPVQTTGVCR